MDTLNHQFLVHYLGQDHDACAIYAAVSKRPTSSGDVPLWATGLLALDLMDHRAGWVDERTDGTGLLTDIPRDVWQARFDSRNLGLSAHDPNFWLLTLVAPVGSHRQVRDKIAQALTTAGFRYVMGHVEITDGEQALENHVLWYQGENTRVLTEAFQALQSLEQAFPGHIASFSNRHTVLKMTSSPAALYHVFETEWGGAEFLPRAVIGHNRFSTNTLTDLARVQPFLGLAHNGEINTIDRLQREMESLGILPIPTGSDSQNADRLLSAFIERFGLTHAEAMRLAISPSPAILDALPDDMKRQWEAIQSFWGPWIEGPAAFVHRHGNSVAAAVDAMGLRPLWLLETAQHFVLSSEPGVVPHDQWVKEPRIIGPGEVIAIEWTETGAAEIIETDAIFNRLAARFSQATTAMAMPLDHRRDEVTVPDWQFVADGWHRDDQQLVKQWIETAHEPIGSLGYDGPLAPFSHDITNLADYLQETVAVVTNPALDRERETEHFRLRVLLGPKPDFGQAITGASPLWLDHPWLSDSDLAVIHEHFGSLSRTLSLTVGLQENEQAVASRLADEALAWVQEGVRLLVLDDQNAYQAQESVSLDPVLAVGLIDARLRQSQLRRQVGIIVRSGQIRHLHDAVVALGLGADALVPYAIWAQVPHETLEGVMTVMNQGLEKILSTMGIHELRGYGRVFSAIGWPASLANALGVVSFAEAPEDHWAEHRQQLLQRRGELIGVTGKPKFVNRATTHIYKPAIKLASGELSADEYLEQARAVEAKHPIALRHTLGFRAKPLSPHTPVSLAVGEHDLPFVISSMSFGSQGETAFRAYAEAAKTLNMLSMNGEGGEIPDMIGKYYRWRGHQVASGRFGINAHLLNGAQYIEIKIGQGAKPGEGGHLPGKKVSAKVANARNALPGIDLISPSNNHDLYSIEDLKQLIDELKEANPDARVIVKVPVVPNIGTIAVGIVKAGADVITLSGFEGGTGAARLHALRHAGLPADVGVPLTHAALTLAGLRDRVEIWADGGMRSADDVLRMILLGANRVGFATMAMVSLGCTVCRGCQLDTCHVGITTQIETLEEAQERGIKHFQLQDFEPAVAHLVRFFTGIAEGLKANLRQVGLRSITEAVGQSHLLVQERFTEAVGYEPFIQSLNQAVEDALAQRNVHAVGEAGAVSIAAHPRWNKPKKTRTIGTELSGQRIRLADRSSPVVRPVPHVAGQGFGAFLSDGVNLVAHGGAQDGVGKSASGGFIAVLKARGADGRFYGGHVGKSLAYGAQGGTIIVQGGADARAGIRLAGASIVLLGDGITPPAQAQGMWQSAVIRGFGFEYMTRGRGLVLGDPGPWLASGMTGGTVYLRVAPELGLTPELHRSRLARSAKVQLASLNADDILAVQDLLGKAQEALARSGQPDRAEALTEFIANPPAHFIKLVPQAAQTDPSVSTE